MERTHLIECQRLDTDLNASEYKDDLKIAEEFENARPKLFGAILTRLSGAMRVYDQVAAENAPRMASAFRWALACAEGAGEDVEEVRKDFQFNTRRQVHEALKANTLATIFVRWCDSMHALTKANPYFPVELAPETLYDELHHFAQEEMNIDTRARGSGFPGAANVMTRWLNEQRKNLRVIGWDLILGEDARGKNRNVVIKRLGKQSPRDEGAKATSKT
jgi:hypothetical protein